MNTTIEGYFKNGCMRCPLGGTTNCKVHLWTETLHALREVILKTELEETVKWGVPCYTYEGANVLLLSALKDFACISFLKGALLRDEEQVLERPGPHSQAARYWKFTHVEQVNSDSPQILRYLEEAIEIQKKGLKIDFKKELEVFPPELLDKMKKDPIFKSAFESLTPGRQRGYLLYFSKARQSQTRINRIHKYESLILNGQGMHDQYTSSKK